MLERERDVDAVVVFTVPMAHLRGIPTYLRERFGVPVIFYDGDVPMSLPEFGGMDTGFNYYHGADPSEYDLVVSNSEGGLPSLLALGARRAEAVFWGADPEFFAPRPVEKAHDVFFYGYGDKFRRDWMATMVGEPSRAAPELEFALGGRDFQGDTGRAALVGDVPFNAFNQAIAAARINLNITRRSHASVFASATARPFELAAACAAIVSNPYDGIERWFEPGEELLVVEDAEQALTAYRSLLDDPAQAEAMGARARERVLDEHTYAHRARQVLDARRPRRSGRVTCLGARRGRSRPERGGRGRRRRRGVPGLRPGARRRRHRRRLRRCDRRSRSAAAGAAVVRLPFNLGIGGAVQTGFKYALAEGYESPIRLDGDGQHDPSELPKLIGPVLAGEADIVVGSRFAGAGTAYRPPLARRVGIGLFARIVSLLVRQRVTDTTSGFQALNAGRGFGSSPPTTRTTTRRWRRR